MAKALICKSAGDWQQVVELREVELPERVGDGMSRIRMLAAAIHPSDFGMMAGTYGKAKSFPCVMGREGVGEVVAGVNQGEIVRIPESAGVWAEAMEVAAEGVFVCPKDLRPKQLALSFINPPTALRVLEDFVALKAGEVVISNAGKSAVSAALVQLARNRGLAPQVVVRNKTAEDETWLKSLGAVAVWDETQEYFKEVKAALALNQVGGESGLRLIKALRTGGVCVTIGGAAREPVRYPTRELIFNDVQLRGFWMDRWTRDNPGRVGPMMEEIWQQMREGKLVQEVAGKFRLEDYREALAKASQGPRRGKIIFVNSRV
jgi:NADPH:quinone reductase-like Zn-dependent oxidoreductase